MFKEMMRLMFHSTEGKRKANEGEEAQKVCEGTTAEGKKAKLLITIHEGRNRQIRRMCERVGMRVDRLKRIQEGSLRLGALASGSWRYLTPEEITDLLK